ncbi:MAG: hypothetical protein PHF00_08825, partial [Elusimicrobia bacterium]|nr:hypothetical protein [Elusimicrobiota bacterium]
SLREERRRAAAAEAMSARQEANRAQVDEQLRAISDALKHERETSHAQGRIEALEERLDKLHETWSAVLQTNLGRLREASGPGQGGSEVLAGLKLILRQLGAIAAALPEAGSGGVKALEARLDSAQKSWLRALDSKLDELREESGASEPGAELKAVSRRLEALPEVWSRALEDGLGKLREELTAAVRADLDKLRQAVNPADRYPSMPESLRGILARLDELADALRGAEHDRNKALEARLDELRGAAAAGGRAEVLGGLRDFDQRLAGLEASLAETRDMVMRAGNDLAGRFEASVRAGREMRVGELVALLEAALAGLRGRHRPESGRLGND